MFHWLMWTYILVGTATSTDLEWPTTVPTWPAQSCWSAFSSEPNLAAPDTSPTATHIASPSITVSTGTEAASQHGSYSTWGQQALARSHPSGGRRQDIRCVLLNSSYLAHHILRGRFLYNCLIMRYYWLFVCSIVLIWSIPIRILIWSIPIRILQYYASISQSHWRGKYARCGHYPVLLMLI